MELSEDREQSANQSVDVTPAQTAAPSPVRSTGTTTSSYVYALGRVTPRFPSLAVEKEFAQATGRAETTGLTDRQALQSVKPLPGASVVLGVGDRGPGNISPCAARPSGLRSPDRSPSSHS